MSAAKDAGFDGIELNYDLDKPVAEVRYQGTRAIGRRRHRHRDQRRLFVPVLVSLVSNVAASEPRMELAKRMTQAP